MLVNISWETVLIFGVSLMLVNIVCLSRFITVLDHLVQTLLNHVLFQHDGNSRGLFIVKQVAGRVTTCQGVCDIPWYTVPAEILYH